VHQPEGRHHEIGMEAVMIAVLERLRRKASRIAAARIPPTSSALPMLSMERRM